MRNKFLFFIVLALILCAVGVSQEPEDNRLLQSHCMIEQHFIQSLTQHEKEELQLLFSTFIYKEPFAYVIFGEKPMALSGGFRKQSWESVLLDPLAQGLIWKRWEIWKNATKRIYFSNFLFLEENYAAAPDIRFIILINKKIFEKTVRVHSKRFREITGRSIDPVILLRELEDGTTTLQQAINFSEELLGILLGFGEKNSALYSRRQKIDGLPVIPYALDSFPSNDFQSIKEEVAYLNNLLQSFSNEDHILFTICPIAFVADKQSDETKALSRKYLKARSRLCKLYSNRSYFEVSIKQLFLP